MLYASGFDPKNTDDIQAVKAKIQELDENFDLVMIQEQFSQSMVLLSQLLCWKYSKLATLKLKVIDQSIKTPISDEARKELEKWMAADYLLYNHFKSNFEQKIAEYGFEKMKVEEKVMQEMNEKLENLCTNGTTFSMKNVVRSRNG
jgi:hypothetical protein